jgi:NAD(P)-dependent dehydrogenase (short-subunit alcohol dehydrogenase family)
MTEPPVPDWLREHYARVDANDFAYLGEKFAPDAEVRFGNRPPALGAAAVADTLADFHRPFCIPRDGFLSVPDEDVAAMAAFLASDLAKQITSSDFRVDGGQIATI